MVKGSLLNFGKAGIPELMFVAVAIVEPIFTALLYGIVCPVTKLHQKSECWCAEYFSVHAWM